MNPRRTMRSRQTIATLLMLLSVLASGGQGMSALALDHSISTVAKGLGQPLQVAASNTIPPAIVATLRQDLSRRTGIPTNQLKFIEVSAQTWPDGCLGLGGANEMCTQAMVNGWRVTFAKGNQRWVYRTNGNGNTFRLETRTQSNQPKLPDSVSLKPAQIPTTELPPRLQQDVLFRAISTGGFAGRTYQTTLYRSGKLVREELRLGGQPMASQVQQIDAPAVQQFMTLVRQQQMQRWHRANYLPTPGSADFITTTLICQSCAVRYADSIQTELPTNLQTVIQAWNNLTRTI